MPLRIDRLVILVLLPVAAAWLLPAPGQAQVVAQVTSTGTMPLPVDRAFALSAARAPDGGVRLEWTIAPNYYLYADKFALRAAGQAIDRPPLQGVVAATDDPTFGTTDVVHDRAALVMPGAAMDGRRTLTVSYQGCQDGGICYPPTAREVDLDTLAVGDTGTSDAVTADPAGRGWASSVAAPEARSDDPVAVAADDAGMVATLLQRGGVPMLLGSFLLFGLTLAFTPCVLPMYPILAGAIARQGEQVTTPRAFSLSLAYVLAMATAFGLLGVAAAWSGQNLQMALQSPLAVGALSVLFALLALSMFGLFELQLPSAWVGAIGRTGVGARGSHLSAATLGFTSALIVGPCVTAPLAGALLYIAQTGDTALGAASLFALGIGKGIPLIAFGTLGPQALPRAGAWMDAVKQAFGFVFLAAAVWMVSRVVPAEATLALWAALALGVATWLGAFDTLGPDSSGRRRAAKATGLTAALYGVLLAIGAASGGQDPLRPLAGLSAGPVAASGSEAMAFRQAADTAELGRSLAETDGRPSLLYVTAEWCVTCAVIDRTVLGDRDVQARLAGFNLVKLDVTENRASQRAMMESLRVVGPPTMIFVDPQGREASGTRLIGDVTTASLMRSADELEVRQ